MIPKFRAWWIQDEVMTHIYTLEFLQGGIRVSDGCWHEKFLGDEVILMQSTGLKDKNGVEIFEGDIVVGQQHLTTDSSTPFEIKGLVRYSKRNTMFYLDEKSFGHDKFMNSLGSSIYQFEVIGNVFANPELLEAIE